MAEQDWPSPYPFPADPLPGAPSPLARYELRPLSVGEILDRIFSLYRAHFWFFVGLSALAAAVSAGTGILRLVYQHFSGITAASPSFVLINGVIGLVQAVLYLVAYSVTLAATTSAVHSLYLGNPTSLQMALATARKMWLRCLGISFWQAWSGMWVTLFLVVPMVTLAFLNRPALVILLGIGVFASVIYGVIAYLRNSLAVPAAVIEDLGVRAAMRRSKRLAAGSIGRIFLMLLLFYVLMMVAGLIEAPLAFIILRSPAAERLIMQALILAINFIATSIVGPIAAIGLCLFYFDERIRREGFDIEMLLHGTQIPPTPVPLAPAFTMSTDISEAAPSTPEQI
jgi:hypothetical protein